MEVDESWHHPAAARVQALGTGGIDPDLDGGHAAVLEQHVQLAVRSLPRIEDAAAVDQNAAHASSPCGRPAKR